jgi:hypothetical protein
MNLLNIKDNRTFIKSKSRHMFYSDPNQKKTYIYHVAIIDYLTKFNFHKKREWFLKVKLQQLNPEKISVREPVKYQERFH